MKQSSVIVVLVCFGLKTLAGAEPGYVDGELCAGCHAQAAQGYARSGMARTFGAVKSATVPAGSFQHQASGQNFTVSIRSEGAHLQRSVGGSDVLDGRMDYWIGSGNHARSYLSRGSLGKLTELPLTWYSLGAKWGMSPGYDNAAHAGFSRKITYGCLFCHAGYPDIPQDADRDDSAWKLPAVLPKGIDCQRCHGPGQAHVEAVKQGQPADRIRAAIVNPKKLDAVRNMEVCLQCHLETTTVRLPGTLRKYGRDALSYRAGESLQDFVLHFEQAVDKDRDARVEFAGEAYRLRMSPCFRESQGALTCTTCHNPHSEARDYNAICESCHKAAVVQLVQSRQHPVSRDCVTCHMPKRRPVDALNTLVSDHFIRKVPAPEPRGVRLEHNDTTSPPYRGEVLPYYPEVSADSLYVALAQVKHRANLDLGLPRFDALIRQLQPPQGEFYLDLADAWRQAGQPARGVDYAREAVSRMRGNWRAWFGLGNMLTAAGDASQAAEALKTAIALNRDDPEVWQALGEAYSRLGNFGEALSAFRSAIAADPQFAPAHNNAGTTLLRAGDTAGAEKELREAVRLRPESAVMQVNLAAFLAARGGMAEARRRFTLALKINPGYAEGHSAYGAALAAARDWTAARTQYAEAVRLNPNTAVTRHNYGVVLLELKDTAGAIREFKAAVGIDPGYREAQEKLNRLTGPVNPSGLTGPGH